MYKRYVAQIIFALTILISAPSWAETEETGPKLAYFTLEPDLTTNFYTKGKKIRLCTSAYRHHGDEPTRPSDC